MGGGCVVNAGADEGLAKDQASLSAARKFIKAGSWPTFAAEVREGMQLEREAAVMASIPGLSTKLVCFDTSFVDLTEELADPVEVLFGVKLGGGTDINAALAYCEKQIEVPAKTHFVLITDLYEGGDAAAMLARASAIKQSGVNLIVLLALSDEGHASYDANLAAAIAGMGCPVFACTPDQFPAMMACALAGRDLQAWAAEQDIALVRGE